MSKRKPAPEYSESCNELFGIIGTLDALHMIAQRDVLPAAKAGTVTAETLEDARRIEGMIDRVSLKLHDWIEANEKSMVTS